MTQIEPELSLALSMINNPGVYVPLVGSGVSRSSGILTGWDITLDLIRDLAHLKSEDCEPAPDKWFAEKFGKEPRYSDLLEELAKTPSERQGLLRRYFEPTEEERENGEKVPQRAHKAIASLVKDGLVRIVLTTNFDRLLERACEEVGIVPTVISKGSDISGARPFHQTRCTIVKLHGDYLDTRIKNSESELSEYDPAMQNLLDRIFDEHGVIVCGWSAQWDHCLRDAILKSSGRRYQWYWAKHGEIGAEAKRVIDNKGASVIDISSADDFLSKLDEFAKSLKDSSRPHPLSVKTAVSTVKRLLPDEKNEIRVHDLFLEELDSVYKSMTKLGAGGRILTMSYVSQCDRAMEKLRAMVIAGVQWDKGNYLSLWQKMIDRFAKPLMEYPSIHILYSIGLTCTVNQKYQPIIMLLKNSKSRTIRGEEPFCTKVYPGYFRDELNKDRNDGTRYHTPLNDMLYDSFKEHFIPVTFSEEDFDSSFREFEYLWGLVCASFHQVSGRIWGPGGRFVWQSGFFVSESKKYFDEVFKDKSEVVKKELLVSGLFANPDLMEAAILGYDKVLNEMRRHWL